VHDKNSMQTPQGTVHTLPELCVITSANRPILLTGS